MKARIRDVARRAGVSASTVTRVIQGSDRISEATKERVRRAMRDLQYRPHAVARSLAVRSTRTLGLVLPNDPSDLFLNAFFIQAMRGLSIYVQQRGYQLMYAFSRDEQVEVQFIRDYVDSNWIDGVILLTTRRDDQCIAFLESRRFPYVVIGRPDDPNGTYWVDNDNRGTTALIVERLAEQGHRTIAFLGGPMEFTVTRERLAGYRHALAARGLETTEDLIGSASSFTEEAGYRCALDLLDRRPIDALVTTDDVLAFGALRSTADRGRVDVAVTGFNNTVRGQYQAPTLTTVDISPEELGERAGRLLIDLLSGDVPETNHYIVPATLLERQSTIGRMRTRKD